MVLIIDNYDSFTQNLVQCVGKLGFDVCVFRNDDISLQEICDFHPTHIILSPGPGKPTDTGISLDLIMKYASDIPILGVCLGHQSIGYTYGSLIKQLNQPVHGKLSEIWHNSLDLFHGLPNPFWAARYHSLIVDNNQLSQDLDITAWTQEGIVMACRHKRFSSLRGIQFHPESLWTSEGETIIKNFLTS